MGFLASLGIKDAIYGLLIASLLGLFGWYTVHERNIGEAKIVAADAKAVAAQDQRDSALKTLATLGASVAQGDYSHEVATPVIDAPVPDRLCRLALGSGKTIIVTPGAASGDTGAAGGVADAGSTPELQQFADDAVKIAKDDDAQVIALQTILADIRKELGEANVE